MRRGEYLEERVPDLEATIEEYFGPISGTEEVNGHDLYVVGEPTNPAFERIVVGAASYPGKKDQLVVHFEERPAEEIIARLDRAVSTFTAGLPQADDLTAVVVRRL